MALQRPRSWTEIEEDEAYKALAPDRKLKLLGHWTDQVRDYASATGALSRDYNVSAINDFRSRKEQEITAAAAPPPEKPFFRLGDVGSALAGIPEDLYYGVPVAMRRLSEGLNRPDQYSEETKQAFAAERARMEQEQKEQQERELRGETSAVGDALRQASDSAAFSIANMAVAIPAATATTAAVSAAFPPAAPVTAPLTMAASAGAAMLTSAPVAYRIAGNQFLDDAFAELTKKKGAPLTETEKQEAYDELLPIAQNTALWEAGPEAVGNAVTLGVGKFVFGFGKDAAVGLASKAIGKAGQTTSKEYAINAAAGALAKTGVKAPTAEMIEATAEQALKEAGKSGIRRAVEKGAAVLADAGVETTTEAITQVKQGYDQAKMQRYVQTGSTEGAVNEYEGLAGFGKAYKEVFGPTVATLGLFGATAGAVKAASSVLPGNNQQKKEKVIDDIVTGAAALTNRLETTGSPQTAKAVGDMAAKQAQRILSDQENQENADDETTREILDEMEAKAAAEKPPVATTTPTDPAAPIEDRIKTAMDELAEARKKFDAGSITSEELGAAAVKLNELRTEKRSVARGEGDNVLQQYVDKTKVNSNDILDLLSEYGGIDAQTLADVQNPEAAVAWLQRNNIGVPGQPWRGRTLTPFGDQGAGTPLFDQAPKEPAAAAPKVPVEFSPETLAGQTDDEFNESERVVRGAVARLKEDAPELPSARAALANIEAERERRGPVKPKQPAPAPRTLDQFTDDELDQEETLLQRKVETESDPVLLEEANAQLQAVTAERQRRNPPKPAAPVVDKKQPAPAPKTLDQFTDDELDQEETLLQRTIDTETDPVVVEETNTKLQAVAAERQRRTTLTLKPSALSAPKVTNTSRENLVLVSGQPELPKQEKKDVKPKVEDSPDQGKLNLGEGGAGTQRDVKLTEGLKASGVKVTNPSEAAANYRKSLVEEARKARRLSPVKDVDTVLKDLEGQAWVPPQYKSPVRRREFAKQLLDEARTARSEELGVGTKTIVPGSQAEAKIYDDSISSGQVPSAKKILNRLSKEANVGKKTGNVQKDAEREGRLENLRQQTREIQTEASRLVAATLGIPNPESVTFAPDFTGKNSLPQRSVTKGKVTKLENIFVNDADITARQLDRGMDITIPKGQRNNVVEGITYDRKTGKVTAAVSGDTIVSKPDQLKQKRDTKRKKLDATFTIPEESPEKLGANGQPDPNGKTRFEWAMERARELTGEAEKKWSATVTNIARAEITGWSANLGERVRTVALIIASESALKGKNITATESIKQASQKFSERVRTRPDLATEYSLDQTVGTSGATGYDLTPDGPQRGVGPQGTRSDASKLLARMTNAEAARIMTDLSQKLDEDRPLTAVEKQSLSAAQEFTNLRDQLRFQGKLKNIPESELPELTYGELLNISGEDPQLQGRFADETMGAGAAQTSAPNIDNLPDDSYLSADSAVNPEEEEKIQVTEEEIAQAKALVDSVWKSMPMIGRIIETLYRGARAFVTANRRDAVYVNFANIARAIQGLDEDAARTFIKRLLNHEGRHLALLRNMTLEELKDIGNGMTQAQKLAAGMSYFANYKYTSEEQRAADMKKFMEDPTTMAMEYLTMLSERMQAGESVQDLDLKNFPQTTLQKIIAALRAILTQFQTRMLMRSEYNAALAVGIGRLEKGIRDLENEANMAERIEEANAADEAREKYMVYAGEGAQDMPQLLRDSNKTAVDMKAANQPSETIRKVTGWFVNPYDGRLRWEIPDAYASFNKSEWDKAKPVNGTARTGAALKRSVPLKSLLSHDLLFKAYPQLADIKVIKITNNILFSDTAAAYNPDVNAILINSDNADFFDMRMSLLHEIQHAIQHIEGFASGADIKQSNLKLRAALEAYDRSAGEIEARDVETRSWMSVEELAKNAPYSSEKIPAENVLVEFDKKFLSRADDYTPEIPGRTATPNEITLIQQKNRDAAKAYLDTLPPGAYDVVDENGDPVGSIEVRMQERTGTARKEGVSPTLTKIRPEGPQDLFDFMGAREVRGYEPQTRALVRSVSFVDLDGMPQPTSRALDALVPNPKGKEWSVRSVVPQQRFESRADNLGVDDDGFLRPMQDARGRIVYRVKINGIPFETTAPDAETAVRNAAARMFDDAKVVRFEGGRYTSVGGLIAAMTKNAKVWWGKNWAARYARPAVRVAPDRTPILPATKSEQAELPLFFASMANPSMRVRVGQVNPEGRPKGGFWDRLKLMVRGRFSETKKRTGGVSGSGAATPMERDAILAQQARIKGTIVKAESMVKNYRSARKKHKDFTDEQINAALGTTENPFTDAQVKELNKIKDAKARDAKREEFRKANANTDRLVRLQALSQLPGFNPKFDGETEFHTGLAKAVEDMRVAIDEMSRALMSGDYIPADLKPRVEQNLNVYVHRSYTIFDNPEWKRFMLEPQTDEHRRIQSGAARLFQKYAVAEIAQELRAEAEKAGAPMSQRDAIRLASRERERIATRAGNMLVDYLSIADDKSNNFFVTGELPGQRKLDIIKVRGQIPKEVRELWGEIQKADDNFLKTMSKMAGYMSATDTARELVRIGLEQKYMWKEGISEGERPAGFHLIYRKGDASPLSVSPMDGVYAPAEVGEFMRSFRDHKTMYGWARQLAFMTAGTMAMKTIGNFPQGYVRNFFGNPFIMVNGGYINPGHPAEMYKAAKKAFKLALTSSGLRNNEAVVKSVSELTTAGLIGEGVDSGLMREMTDTGLGDLTWDKLYEAGAYETAMKRAARQATGTTRNTFEFFARIYQGVDDFWKVFAYEMEKFYQRRTHKDWTEAQISKEAIDRVRNKVPTYSLSPELTRNIRNIPFIAPFITWTSETIRTSANNLAIAAEDIRVGKETKNPEMVRNGWRAIRGFAFALGAFPTLAILSKAMFGYDDEDEDAYREGLPEWEQNASLVFLGKAADGTGSHFNASFLDPYQSRMEGPTAFMRAMRRGDAFTDALVQGGMETLRPLLSEQLLFGAITSILRNRTAQGKPIYNEQDTAFNKTRDTMGYLALAAGPGTIVGAGRRLYLASQGTVLPTGQTYDVGNELLGMFGGQKVSSIDFRTTLNRAKNRYASSKAEATQLFSQVFSSQGTVDLEDIGPAYENAARAHRELQEEMMRAFDNAIRMGVPRKDAIRILRGGMGGAEVSKDDLRAILSGKPRRWTPSEVSLDSAKEGKIPDGRARLKALRDYMRSVKGAGNQ